MASVFGISLLSGCFMFFVVSLFLDLAVGNVGKTGQIKSHYSKIKGMEGIAFSDKDLNSELNSENSLKYKKISFITAIGVFAFSYIVFFGSLIVALFLFCTVLVILPKILSARSIKKREKIINAQLRDALNDIKSSLKSGLSLKSALDKVPENLARIHATQKKKIIIKEFINIKNDLNMGVTVEDALIGFRDRLNSEEAEDFVNSIIILKQKGGNLVEVLENTIKMISDKMKMKSEINTLITGKKVESKIITVLPVLAIVFQALTMREHVRPLFEGVGNFFSMIAFLLLLINYVVGDWKSVV